MFIEQLRRNFKITTGTLSSFLLMQIEQHQNGIFVCQRDYTEKVLEQFKMHEANPVAAPCDCSSGATEDSVESHVPHRESLGCLTCLIWGTRPNIAFAVSRAARAMNRPTEVDWIYVKRILKYLQETKNFSFLYGAGNSKGVLEAFSNVDSKGDV